MDADGLRCLDCAGGGVRPLGWTHSVFAGLTSPVVVNDGAASWPAQVDLMAALAEMTPGGTNRRVLLCRSGREALARGLELARRVTGRAEIIYLSESASPERVRLDRAAAVVCHPFDNRLAEVRRLADSSGAWLIDDETRIAPGTTGRMLAIEHSGVRADLHVLGPGAAAGMALGACITSSSRHRWPIVSDGPSPAACEAGCRYFTLLKSGLVDRATAIAERFERTSAVGPDCAPGRRFGIGAHWTLCFDEPGFDPARVIRACRERGVLLAASGNESLAVRPALVMTDDELETALTAIAEAVRATCRGACART